MIRDRGKIKWTSLMLPEHVKMIRDWAWEDDHHQEKPELDEQQLDEMNQTICEAIENQSPVTITYFEKHTCKLLIGMIHYYDEGNCRLKIVDQFQDTHRLYIEHIIDVRSVD